MDFNLALRGGHASNAIVHPAPTETTKARQPKGLPQHSSEFQPCAVVTRATRASTPRRPRPRKPGSPKGCRTTQASFNPARWSRERSERPPRADRHHESQAAQRAAAALKQNRVSTLRGGHASEASVHPAPTETTKARQPKGLPQRSSKTHLQPCAVVTRATRASTPRRPRPRKPGSPKGCRSATKIDSRTGRRSRKASGCR